VKEIDIKQLIESKAPEFFEKKPAFVNKFILFALTKLLKLKEINEFIRNNQNNIGLDFINSLFDTLGFSYKISDRDKNKIPSEGRLVIVSNHPLGGLDGLALVKAIREVRPDARIVANDLLMKVENLSDVFLPLDIYSISSQRTQIATIEQALLNEEAVIIFPSGKVSRLSFKGIRDRKWLNGATKFSTKTSAPILPIFIKGRNSLLFYFSALINDKLGMLMLPGELFRHRRKAITILVGEIIPSKLFNVLKPKVLAKLLLQHTYKLGAGKVGNFKTDKTVIHPVEQSLVEKELKESELLGSTFDDKRIYLVDYSKAQNVMKEISRLRELTFRKVGEGTGKICDIDIYDFFYKHIILWDDEHLDIVGSYRLGIGSEIIHKFDKRGLYNSSLFSLNEGTDTFLSQSIEVGRSFIQQKYWNSNALDLIWQGMVAFIIRNPEIRYAWGAVSISDSYSGFAKALIISYYKKWYGGNTEWATPIYEYDISDNIMKEVEAILTADNYIDDLKNLKEALRIMNLSVPILLRRYTELCEYGGATIINWCVNVNFNNSVDGLIVLDLTMMKEDAKKRLYNQKSFVNK